MKRSHVRSMVLVVSGLAFLLAAGALPLSDLWHSAWRLPGHSDITPMFGRVSMLFWASSSCWPFAIPPPTGF